MSVTVTTAFTENNGRQGGDCYTSEWVAKLKRGTEGAALVCGHGDPRFSSPSAGWAHDLWLSR